MTMPRCLILLWASCSSACVGTTGGEILEISASAAGPSDATGTSLTFGNSLGYSVELSEARLFVGGVYLNRSRPTSVASDTSCTLPGIYVAEVLAGREIDLLSPEPQAFPSTGFATTERALTGEVWLAQGDVNQTSSSTVVLRVAGAAHNDGRSYPFEGKLSIGQNRVVPATDPALPGQHPICKQRIVSPIPLDLLPALGRSLLLTIDPREMFGNVDFETLDPNAGVYRFADETGVNQASDNLYAGLRRSSGVYAFEWQEEP
ncbi:MAG TPA: hypothetical protein VJN18_24130 [Polyangiaceae bacterium]|nr:hypothetical protein [Polyangiaceae bacterium]